MKSCRIPLAVLCVLCSRSFAQTPTPGQNVNMVSGTTVVGGDPFLQRQNEPSIAVSTRNPQQLLTIVRSISLILTCQATMTLHVHRRSVPSRGLASSNRMTEDKAGRAFCCPDSLRTNRRK